MAGKLKYLLLILLSISIVFFISLKVIDYITYESCYNMPINEFYGNKMCEKYIRGE